MAAPAVIPGEVGHNANQPLLAWGCAHGGLQCSRPYPHPLPKSTRCVSAWPGGLKSSLWLFDRCNPDKTRKDVEKDAEMRNSQISIKGYEGRARQSRRDSWTGTSPETAEARTWFQGGCGGNHTMGNMQTPENAIPGTILQVNGDSCCFNVTPPTFDSWEEKVTI